MCGSPKLLNRIVQVGINLCYPIPLSHIQLWNSLFFPSPTFSCGTASFVPLPHSVVGEGRVRVLVRFKNISNPPQPPPTVPHHRAIPLKRTLTTPPIPCRPRL